MVNRNGSLTGWKTNAVHSNDSFENDNHSNVNISKIETTTTSTEQYTTYKSLYSHAYSWFPISSAPSTGIAELTPPVSGLDGVAGCSNIVKFKLGYTYLQIIMNFFKCFCDVSNKNFYFQVTKLLK